MSSTPRDLRAMLSDFSCRCSIGCGLARTAAAKTCNDQLGLRHRLPVHHSWYASTEGQRAISSGGTPSTADGSGGAGRSVASGGVARWGVPAPRTQLWAGLAAGHVAWPGPDAGAVPSPVLGLLAPEPVPTANHQAPANSLLDRGRLSQRGFRLRGWKPFPPRLSGGPELRMPSLPSTTPKEPAWPRLHAWQHGPADWPGAGSLPGSVRVMCGQCDLWGRRKG